MIEVKEVKINQNDPKVKKYEQSYLRGLEKLTDEQRKRFEQSDKLDIKNESLKKALNKNNTAFSRFIRSVRQILAIH